MKVKVLKPFIDKHTKQFHYVGEVFDVTEGRLEEILAIDNFVEVVKPTRTKK